LKIGEYPKSSTTNILAVVNGAQLAASDGYRPIYFETDSLLFKERMEQSDVDQSGICISMEEPKDFLSQNFDFVPLICKHMLWQIWSGR
jgi:hypothetical protein